MPLLRVVLKDDATVRDATDVLRSFDELARILTWVSLLTIDPETSTKSTARRSTRRSVDGLVIREVQGGSLINDLAVQASSVPALLTGGSIVLGAKVIPQLVDVAERVLDLPTRLAKSKEDLITKRIENRSKFYDLVERAEQVGMPKPSYEDLLDTSSVQNTTRAVAEPEPTGAEATLRQLILATGTEALGTMQTAASPRIVETRIAMAYRDGSTAARRLRAVQRRSNVVEDVRVVEENPTD